MLWREDNTKGHSKAKVDLSRSLSRGRLQIYHAELPAWRTVCSGTIATIVRPGLGRYGAQPHFLTILASHTQTLAQQPKTSYSLVKYHDVTS